MNCDCGFESPSGCACAFLDSAHITWADVAAFPDRRVPSLVIDPRDDNLASCTGGGILVAAPGRFTTRPEARVYRASTQAIADDVRTAVSYDTQQIDTDSMFAATSSQLFINTAGFWLVYTMVRWAASATGWRQAIIAANVDTVIAADQFYARTATDVTCFCAQVYAFSENDFVETYVWQKSGGALNIQAANGTTLNSYNTFGAIFLGDR